MLLIKLAVSFCFLSNFYLPFSEAQGFLGGLGSSLGGILGGNKKPNNNANNQQGQGGNKVTTKPKQNVDLNLGILNVPLLNIRVGSGQNNANGVNKPDGKPNGAPVGTVGENNNLGLNWGREYYNGTGVQLGGQDGESRFYFLANKPVDEQFQTCRTPLNQRGRCRHLEHCVLDTFKNDFYAYLQYSCVIRNRYVGVCCPEPDAPVTFAPSATTTTRPPPPVVEPVPQPPFIPTEPVEPLPTRRQCGISEKQIPRIVGGRLADPKAWPWMAALLRADGVGDARNGQFCGGVLISEFHVLTASHCVDGFEAKDLKIRLGEYDFDRFNDSVARDYNVVSIKMHENYNRYNYKNDIALVTLSDSAYFNRKIRHICLPPPNEQFINQVGIVTGWGTIYYGGPVSSKLMEVIVPVWKQEDCQAAYTQPIEETNLCAGVRSGGRDSCQGDSGGPLQHQIRDRWYSIGVVSWGIRCAEPGYPGVYSRVNKYLEWLRNQMK